MKYYVILFGISIGMVFLLLFILYYLGGIYLDVQVEGYDWVNNYISNLFCLLVVNGEVNFVRLFVIFGVLFLIVSFGWFFVWFFVKFKIKSVLFVIKYLGILVMLFGFVIVVLLMYDLMVMLLSIFMLLIFFYIMVMVLKLKLIWLKVMLVLFLVIFYFGVYMYFFRFQLVYMLIVQKIIFLMKIIWVVLLEYGIWKEDFVYIFK